MKNKLLYYALFCFYLLINQVAYAQTDGIGSGNALRLTGAGQYAISDRNGGFTPLFGASFNFSFWVKFEQDPTPTGNNAWLVDIANNLPVSVGAATTTPTDFYSLKYIAWDRTRGWLIGFRDNTPAIAGNSDDDNRAGDFVDFYFAPTTATTPQQNVWIHVAGSVVVNGAGTSSSARMVINGIELDNAEILLTLIGAAPGYASISTTSQGTTANNSGVPLTINRVPRPIPDPGMNDNSARAFIGLRPQGNFANTGVNFQIDELLMANTDRTAAQTRTNMCAKYTAGFGSLQTYHKFDEIVGSTTSRDFNNAGNGAFGGAGGVDTQLTLVGGAAIVLSGAPIGNTSNAGTGTTLAYSTGTVEINVTTGTASVLHIYNVSSAPAAPNNVNPMGMSSIDGRYFGVFTGRSATNLTYTLTYNHGGTATLPNPPNPATSPLALAVAKRLRNDGGPFTFDATGVAAATTHSVAGLTMDLAAAPPINQQEFIYGALVNPILANIEVPALAYTEGGAATAITSTTTVTYGGTLTSGTVQITGNYQNGQDILGFINGNYGGVAFTGVFTAATGLMTITPDAIGTATATAMQAALRAVTYLNNSNNPSTLTRTVTFTVIDGATNSNTQTRDIAITAVNTAPTLTAQTCSAGTFTEAGAATQILTAITANDLDNTTLSTATITITNVQAGDVLSFTPIGGNPVTAGAFAGGTLTLNANGATHAQMSAALLSVFFANSSQNPITTARNINFTVSDGLLSSTPAITCVINVTAVNNPPVISGTTSPLAYVKLAPAISVATPIAIADPDDTQLTAASVIITDFTVAQDEFRFAVPLPAGITSAQVDGTGLVTAATVNFVSAASTNINIYRALLASLTYRNISAAPAPATRTVAFQVTDNGSGATLGVLPNLINPQVVINIDATFNVAPTLDAGCPVVIRTFTENMLPLPSSVSLFPANPTVTDADDLNLSQVEFKFTGGYQTGQDELFYDGVLAPFASTGFNAATGILVITGVQPIAAYQAIMQNIKYRNTNIENPIGGNRTVAVTFSDNGFAGVQPVKTTIPCNIIVNVVPINDAPTLANIGVGAVTYIEQTPLGTVLIDNTVAITDLDNTTMASATAQITTNYLNAEDVLEYSPAVAGITAIWNVATGTLTLSGTATIANYQTALQSIRYRNTSRNPNTALTRTVSFQVNDGQGANNLSLPILTRNVNVTPVNDAPVLAAVETPNLAYTEFEAAKQITNTITVNDVDNTTLVSATISISGGFAEDVLTYTPVAGVNFVSFTAGVLTLNGTATLLQYQAALRNVTYSNTSRNPNTSVRTVSFVVNDGSVVAPINLNSAAVTRQINIIPVNDAPVVANTSLAQTYTENETAKSIFLTPANFTVTDVDNANLASATVQITGAYAANQDVLAFTNTLGIIGTWNLASGTLTLSGAATIANYETAIRSVTYFNSSENPSGLQRTMSISVNDGLLSSNIATQLVNVIPVNDAPVVGNFARRTGVNITLQLNNDVFLQNYNDIENDAMQSISIATLPSNGTLTQSGVPVFVSQVITSASIALAYTPNRNYEGNDSFEWRASDGALFSIAAARANIVVGATSIYPPINLKAKAGSQQVFLTWEPVVVAGVNVVYEIYAFSANQAQKLVGTTDQEKFTVTGLENAVTYVFRVLAVDDLGRTSDFSNPATARPSIILGAEEADLANLNFALYPNPNTGNFVLLFEEKASKNANIQIFNTLGQKVFGKEIQSVSGKYEEKIDSAILAEGTYILYISTGTNNYQKRFVVQK